MVFKRFIYRNGKKLGPYYYKNVRDKQGKVKTIYLGTKNPDGDVPEPIVKEKVGIYRVNEEKINPIKEERTYIPSFSIRTNLVISLLLLVFVLWILFSDSAVKYEVMKISDTSASFEINQYVMRFLINEGGSTSKDIKINNLDTRKLFTLNSNLNMVSLSSNEIYLDSGQGGIVKATVNGGSYNPGVYSGKISINSEEDIPVVVEIESENALFDVNLNAIVREIKVGNNLPLYITLFNLLNEMNTKVKVNYFVKDLNNNIIIEENEELIVNNRNSYLKEIYIPENLNFGKYIVGIVINYGSSYGTNSYFFDVVKEEMSFVEKLKSKPVHIVLFSFAVLMILLLSTYFHYHIGRKVHEKIHGKRSGFIIILIGLLLAFVIYRIGLIYKDKVEYYFSIYWPIITAKVTPVLLTIKEYIPYKNPLFYPILEITIAILIIIIVVILHRRRSNVDVRNYILVKKLCKIIKKEENEAKKRGIYKKALNLYNGLSERRRKKLEKKVIGISKIIKDEN